MPSADSTSSSATSSPCRASWQTREGACCRFVGDVPANPVYHGYGFGIGLRNNDTALKAAFDGAIAAVEADGTYDRIRAKYVPFDTKG